MKRRDQWFYYEFIANFSGGRQTDSRLQLTRAELITETVH